MGLPRNTLDLVHVGHPRGFAELNGFEGQLVTLFRQLSPDDQHDALRALAASVEHKRKPPPKDKH